MTNAATYLSTFRRPSKPLFSLRMRMPQGIAATARQWIPPIPSAPAPSAQKVAPPLDAIGEALKAPSGFIPFTNYRFSLNAAAKLWRPATVPVPSTTAEFQPAPAANDGEDDALGRILAQSSGFIAFGRPNPEFFDN